MNKGLVSQALQSIATPARRWFSRLRPGSSRLIPAIVASLALGVLTACGGSGTEGSVGNSQPVTPAPSTTSLQNCNSIMPLGDSITLGVNGGYRNDLYTGLQQNNCGVSYAGTLLDAATLVDDKRHEGHSGFTIGNIASSADAWLASAQPGIILLMIGTNDTAWWSAENADQIGARHDALIEQVRIARPGAWIFVASIPPQASAIIQPNNIDRAVLTEQLNAVIRNNVDARVAAGQQVRFVDVNSALTTDDLYDGIHPSEAAHAKIAQKFLEAVRAVLVVQ